jgi:hypothetical protein
MHEIMTGNCLPKILLFEFRRPIIKNLIGLNDQGFPEETKYFFN